MAPAARTVRVPRPPNRRLRVFAFDPILSRRLDTQEINEVTLKIPWEDNLKPGPLDDYVEVVDYDPASQAFYAPVDLNTPHILAQDGLPPSEGNPQFHQQMVYAVARTTIRHFEQALGRRALWSPRLAENAGGLKEEFVERLRLYPHALREANAYYSPDKKALLFGYFPASASAAGENLPGEMVYTCLSHDIVAHETAHALLDGLHQRFLEPTNPDLWALHEAFADIVALFQHFTYPEVLRHQIAQSRGDLESQSLLGELAFQFGQAIGRYGALRGALGEIDPATGKWIPKKPNPEEILTTTEPHARGAILVAAVFEAFLSIYQRRVADLWRLATGGTGFLRPGELHPDLVRRLAQEAAKTASHLLHMCIRALDYCPPVDVDLGDYLRALITADADLVTDDRHHYRLAVMEAFRRRGIYPREVRHLSEESLLWHKPGQEEQEAFRTVFRNSQRLRQLVPDWGLTTNRREIFAQAARSRAMLHRWFTDPRALPAAKAAYLVLDDRAPQAFHRDRRTRVPKLEVHAVRPARRVGPEGDNAPVVVVVEMTQGRYGYFDPEVQEKADSGEPEPPAPDFIFRGGCTLLIDPDATVRYCIYKNILNHSRLKRLRKFLAGEAAPSPGITHFGDVARKYFQMAIKLRQDRKGGRGLEPLALLHRSYEPEEGW